MKEDKTLQTYEMFEKVSVPGRGDHYVIRLPALVVQVILALAALYILGALYDAGQALGCYGHGNGWW